MSPYEREWREQMRERGASVERIDEMWVGSVLIARAVEVSVGQSIQDEALADVCDYVANRWPKWVGA